MMEGRERSERLFGAGQTEAVCSVYVRPAFGFVSTCHVVCGCGHLKGPVSDQTRKCYIRGFGPGAKVERRRCAG